MPVLCHFFAQGASTAWVWVIFEKGGDAMRQPDVTPDDRALSDGDASQHGGVGIDRHLILDDRMAGEIHGQSLLV